MNLFNSFFKKSASFNFRTAADSVFSLSLPSSDSMSAAVELWTNLYQNTPPWLGDSTKSLNLAAGIASELARLSTIDMVSEIQGSERAVFLNEIYQRFLTEKHRYVELAAALGGIIFKPGLYDGRVSVDFIPPSGFIPVSFDGFGHLTSAVFLDRITVNDTYLTRLEYHRPEGNGYVIENRSFKSSQRSDLGKEIPLASVSEWKDIEPIVYIESLSMPLFTYFKMPYSNTVDPLSPLGISAFASACGLIRDADEQYSRLLWEFESGERALYLDRSAFTRDRNGNPIIPDKRLYRTISADENLFRDWSPVFRDDSILQGLNSILRKIEFCCGLSFGTISDETMKGRTAEEIRSSKQRSYSTVCDIQIAFKNALSDLVSCLDRFCTLYSLVPKGEYSVSFSFDDSIVADRKTEFEERLQLLNSGILLPHEFRMWYFGEDEKTAKSILNPTKELL